MEPVHVWGETASEPVKSAEKALGEHFRYIPFSDLKEILDGATKGLFLPRTEYESMKEAKDAFLARGPRSPIPVPPQEISWGQAEYRGSVHDRWGSFEAEYLIDIHADRWVEVALPGGDIAIDAIIVDGKPAGGIADGFVGIQDQEAPKNKLLAIQSSSVSRRPGKKDAAIKRQGYAGAFRLVLRGPGRHRVLVKFVAAQIDDPSRDELTFRIPRVPMNSFRVRLAESGAFGEVDRAEGAISTDLKDKGTEIAGNLGPTDRFSLRWAPRTQPTATPEPSPEPTSIQNLATAAVVVVAKKVEEPPKLFSDSFILLSFGEGFIRSDELVRVNITRSPVGVINLAIPSGTEVLDVRGDRLESFQIEPASTGSRLVCRLNARTQAIVELAITAETKMGDTSGTVRAPVHRVEGVERDRGYIGVEARTSIEIRRRDDREGSAEAASEAASLGTAVSAVDVSELPAEVAGRATRPILLAWRYQDPIPAGRIVVDVVRHGDITVLNSVIDAISATTVLAIDKTSVSCLDLQVKNNGKQYLEARLPTGSELISASVDGAPVKPSSRGEGAFLIPLMYSKSDGAELTAFGVRLLYRAPVPPLHEITKLGLPLPVLGLTASRLVWDIFVPEGYSLLTLKSNLDRPERDITFFPFRFAESLWAVIFSVQALMFLVVMFFGLVIVRWARGPFDNTLLEAVIPARGFTTFVSFFVLIAIGASVCGPMIGSITDQGKASFYRAEMANRAHIFNTKQSLSAPAPAASPMSMADQDDYSGLQESDSRSESKEEVRSKSNSSRNMPSKPSSLAVHKGGASSGYAGKSVDQVRRTVAGRDRGAFPVEMQLPKNGSSVRVTKNVLIPEETAKFVGVALWGPLAGLVPTTFGLLGLVVYVIMLFFAVRGFSLLPSALFVLYSLFLLVLEEWIPESQHPGIAAIMGGLFITLIIRLMIAMKAASADDSGIPSGNPPGTPPIPPSGSNKVSKSPSSPVISVTQTPSDQTSPLATSSSGTTTVTASATEPTASQTDVAATTPGGIPLILLLIALFCGFSLNPARAANTVEDPREKKTVDVFVPYSQLGERLPKDFPLVFLKFEEYKYLQDLGLPEPDPLRLVPPAAFTVLSGVLQGQTVEDRVELTARFEIELLGKGYKAIPFPISGLGIRTLLLNGETVVMAPQAPLTQGNSNSQMYQQNAPDMQQLVQQNQQIQQIRQMNVQVQQSMNIDQMNAVPSPNFFDRNSAIWTDREGLVVLEAVLVKDLFSKNEPRVKVEGFQMPLPSFAVMKLDLTVSRTGQRIEVNPSVGLVTTDTATATRVIACLQPGPVLNVEWRDRVAKAVDEPQEPDADVVRNGEAPVQVPAPTPAPVRNAKVFLDQELLFSIMEGSIGTNDLVRMQIEGAPVGEFFFRLPTGVEVIDVSGGDIAAWNVKPASSGQELRVALNARRMDRVEFRIDMERQTPQINGEFELELPVLLRIGQEGSIERQKGWFAVESREGLEVRIDRTDPATRIDPQELPAGMRNQARGFLAHAFKFLQTVSPIVQVTKHQEVSVSTVQIDSMTARTLVTRDGEVMTRMQMTMRNNNNQFLVLGKLSPGMKIATVMVNGEPVKPGLSKSGETYIPLIRSPRRGKQFEPFGVAIIFEERQAPLRGMGRIALILPGLSFDVAVMAWEIHTPDGYFMMKSRGDFSPGMPEDIQPMPGRVQGGDMGVAQRQGMMSNVVGKARGLREDSAGGGSGASSGLAGGEGAGLLPVTLEIPTTNHVLVFHRNIMSKQADHTEIVLAYGRESGLRPAFLIFALLIALLTSWTLMCLLNRTWVRGIFGGIVIGLFGLVLTVFEGTFALYVTFLPRIWENFSMGVQFGVVLLLAWLIMSGVNPLANAEGIAKGDMRK
ncbi:MAG: hypothetical protein WA705_11865 [Candidatus Ozemobacteraceae bacterium]